MVFQGYVRDATSQGINSARVTVYAGDRVVGVDDTAFGEYIIGGLLSGTYAVEVTHASDSYRREWYRRQVRDLRRSAHSRERDGR